MKVDIVSRERQSEGLYLVQRVDHRDKRFKVTIQELTRLGSHDPLGKHQIQKVIEFQRLEELLKKEGCAIEKMEEDGNCLFRAVARQIYGDPGSIKRFEMKLLITSLLTRVTFQPLRQILTGG